MADMSDNGYRTMFCVEAAITAEDVGSPSRPTRSTALHRHHLTIQMTDNKEAPAGAPCILPSASVRRCPGS